MNQKKIYQKPVMKMITLKHRPRLLAGSDRGDGGEMNYIPRYDNDMNHMA